MAQIKIISNPYDNSVSYYRNNAEKWVKIDNENSKLIKTEFQNGVFPFFAKKVIDIIIEEYSENDQMLDIVFEGTDDEYKDLKRICQTEKYKPLINIIKSDRYLRNGSSIIKDVEDIFLEMEPLIQESVSDTEQIKSEKDKFKDVTKKAIPICVIGNYSAGKSTFINALIGREILPSADQSLTSRIYRIEESKNDEKASIAFCYSHEKVTIIFDEGEFGIRGQIPFKDKISEELDASERRDITYMLNKTLEIINDRGNDDSMSEIIELTVPFNREGIFGRSKKEFVIFDTPGDNSATNMDHRQVLRKAMQNLSNGLPVFVSENRTLDSTDNQKLCNDILSMPELDRKYTMIIVNKADDADLDEKSFNEERILNQAAPKSMFSGGMYFVSSIVGLGAKTKGVFIDNHYAKLFRRLKDDFSGEDPDYCETLYKFDIMPEQIKSKLLEDAEKVENKLLLNSGLHWIECEIDTFAEKYSPYNKCTQSKRFLDKVIEITMESIKSKIAEFEAAKKKFSEELDDMKADVINKLEECNNDCFESYKAGYNGAMEPPIDECHKKYLTRQALENWENELTKSKKDEYDFENRYAHIEVDGMLNQWLINRKIDISKREAEKEINDNVSGIIIERVNMVYADLSHNVRKALNSASSTYWIKRTEELKETLLKNVKGASPLTDAEKEELSDIIVNYSPILFKEESHVFIKEDFKDDFYFFGIHFGENKLRYKSLLKAFKTRLDSFIEREYKVFQQEHTLEFEKWSSSLMQCLKDNVVKYNPKLTEQNNLIKTQENEIIRLKTRRQRIASYNNEIVDMMSWKTREME